MYASMAAAIDKKSFWIMVTQAYTEIVNTPIANGADTEVEIAKLITSNPTLRALTDDVKKDKGSLL